MSNNTDRWNKLAEILPEPDSKSPISSLTVPRATPPVDNMIILPGNGVTITECAEKLFTQIAATETMFLRGGEIVEVLPDGCDRLHLKHIPPTAFRSRFEKFGQPFAWRVGANHLPVLKPTVCAEETAKALMASEAAQRLLPPISLITGCPVAIRVGDTLKVLTKGYHRDHFGILITTGATPLQWNSKTAVGLLHWLICEFDFVSPGDRARAFAMLLTPALKMGGIIRGPIPMGVLEADQSQAGKGYFTSLVAAVYNEQPVIVPQRRGGVGSYDESFSQAVVNGRPFILLDNFKGKLDSAYIESFLTAPGTFPARVPNRGSIDVDPARFVLMMTSNGVEMTPDLANRSIIVRIRKREGYAYRLCQDGDLIQFVHAQQGVFLGAVFSLIEEWFRQGRPKTDVASHDFREWAQILDWIVQWAGLGPLLADHRSAQARVSSPATTLLRKLALAVQSSGRLEQEFTASELCTLCKDADVAIEIPGLLANDCDHAMKQMGTLMAKLFGASDIVTIETFQVYRCRSKVPRSGGGHYPGWRYRFTAAA